MDERKVHVLPQQPKEQPHHSQTRAAHHPIYPPTNAREYRSRESATLVVVSLALGALSLFASLSFFPPFLPLLPQCKTTTSVLA